MDVQYITQPASLASDTIGWLKEPLVTQITVLDVSASTTQHKSTPSLMILFHIYAPFNVFRKAEKVSGLIGRTFRTDPRDKRQKILVPVWDTLHDLPVGRCRSLWVEVRTRFCSDQV